MANPDPTLILYSMLEKAEAKAMSDDGGSLALRDMCDDCDDGDGSDSPDRISRYTEVDSCKRQVSMKRHRWKGAEFRPEK